MTTTTPISASKTPPTQSYGGQRKSETKVPKLNNFKIAVYIFGYNYISVDNPIFNANYETEHRYDKSIENLLPVVKILQENAGAHWQLKTFEFTEIREAFANLNTPLLYRKIIEYIDKFLINK